MKDEITITMKTDVFINDTSLDFTRMIPLEMAGKIIEYIALENSRRLLKK